MNTHMFDNYQNIPETPPDNRHRVLIHKDFDDIVRGSTQDQSFVLPFLYSLTSKVLITYKQGVNIKLEKTDSDFTVSSDDTTLSFRLTQAETNKFDHMKELEIQMRCLMPDGTLSTSQIWRVKVLQPLNDTVLTNDVNVV